MASYVIRLTADLDDSKVRQKIRKLQREAKLTFGTTGSGYAGRGKKGGNTMVGATGTTGVGGKNNGMKTYIRDVNKAEKANKRFGSTTLDITKKVIQFGATTAVIRGVTSGIGDMVQNVFELDGALTEFKKVSNYSGKELEKYTDTAFKTGRTVAKTGTEMVQAATEFKKSGFDEKDSMELARVASMYQNVADQELTAGEAANFITSQMKAYNMQAQDAEHIIDAVNEVSNNFAVSSADIATNIGKASAAMATGNITYEQGIGIMTAMTEITRNGAKSARGMVSIQSRYNQILDESSTTGKKLSAWYKEHNIEIKDQNGQLKSFYEVGGKVAEKWKDMSENEKKYYLNIQAGANQSQNLAALMRNYGTAIEATAAAENEQNSAAKENARYMDSLAGKLANLKSAWENFSRTMVNSDMIKDGLETLTKTLDFLASDAGQSMIKVARDVGVMYLAFRGLGKVLSGGKAIAGLLGFGKSTKIVTKALKGGGKHIDDSARAFRRLGQAAGGAAPAMGATETVASSLMKLFAVGGAGWGLLGAAGVVAGLIALNEQLDPDNQYGETVDKLGETKDKIKEINDEIQQLEKKRESGDLSKGEQNRLDLLKQQKEVLEEQLKVYEELEKKQYHDKETKPDKKSGSQNNGVKSVTKGAGGRGTTDQDIVATDKLTSKLKTYNDTANRASQIRRQMYKAQVELNNAQSAGNLEAQAKALGKLDGLMEDYAKETGKLPSEMEATKNKLNEWIDRYGSIQDMPEDMQKSAIEIQKVTKGYDDLKNKISGLSSEQGLAEQLSTQDFQKVTVDLMNMGTAIGVVKNESGQVENINFDKFSASMQAAGMSTEQTEEALMALANTNPEATVTVDGTEVAHENIEGVIDFMDKLNGGDAEATVEINGAEYAVKDIDSLDNYLNIVDGKVSTSVVHAEGTEESKEKVSSFESEVDSLPYQHTTEVTVTGTGDATGEVENVSGQLDSLPQTTSSVVQVQGADAGIATVGQLTSSIQKVPNKDPKVTTSVTGQGKVDSLAGSINALPSSKNIHISVTGSISPTAQKAMNMGSNAKGTRHAPEGLSEVNEEGWELIRDAKTGRLRIAGGGERTITHLNEGDIVYTHAESKRMVANNKDILVPQHKTGKKQKKYNKKYNKITDDYDKALDKLKNKQKVKHLTDAQFQKEYDKLYNSYTKKVQALNKKTKSKKVKKNKSLGASNVYEHSESKADLQHDKSVDAIEKALDKLSRQDYTEKNINAAKNVIEKHKKNISADEAKSYYQQITDMRAERKSDRVKEAIEAKFDNLDYGGTSDAVKKAINNAYKKGQITSDEKHDYLKKLDEYQNDKASRQFKNDIDKAIEDIGVKRTYNDVKAEIERAAKNKLITSEEKAELLEQAKEKQKEYEHDKATKEIEDFLSGSRGTNADLADAKKKIQAAVKSGAISAEEQEEYLKQAYKQNADYNMKMFQNGKVTYTNMKKMIQQYYDEGKLTAAEYYEYLDQLAQEQFEKEKERLNEEKQKNDDKYSLAKAYVNRQIKLLQTEDKEKDKAKEKQERENRLQEEQNKLIEAQNNLMKAKSKLVRVYREGRGFVYEEDAEAIKEATDALKEQQKALADVQQEIKEAEEQEIKDEQIAKWQAILDLFDDLEERASMKELENSVGASAYDLFNSMGTNLGLWGLFASNNLSTSLGYAQLLDTMNKITDATDMANYMNADGTIDPVRLASAIANNRFASGTLNAPAGWARVAENGYEIALLGKGDAVMPHNISKNLMDWGAYSPYEFTKAMNGEGKQVSYNFDKLVLPNVSNANNFIRELNRLPNKALQFGTSRV